ncbi:MAG: sigma-70 family RNA polymerase sigma factor, partial [Chloroflexota bacterium]
MQEIDRVIKQCQDGHIEAFTTLYHHYQHDVYDLACVIMRDPTAAEDIVQETFIAVLKKINSFRGDSAFSTWLKAITINQCRMRLRQKRFKEMLRIEHLAPAQLLRLSHQQHEVDHTVEGKIQKENIWDLVDQLQDHLRIPLILRYRYGLSCQEIAQAM